MLFFNKKLIFSTTTCCTILPGFFFISPGGSIDYKIITNYNGQADLLLSLQIPPDYYPYQFKKVALYDYLTEIDKYVLANDKTSDNKKKIKTGLQRKLNELLGNVKEFGPSLWNSDLYDTGLVFRNNQYWNTKKTALLFLEQFIADDYPNIVDSFDLLPIHDELIITNYRAAQDPYTIFSEDVFKAFNEENKDKNGKGGGNGKNGEGGKNGEDGAKATSNSSTDKSSNGCPSNNGQESKQPQQQQQQPKQQQQEQQIQSQDTNGSNDEEKTKEFATKFKKYLEEYDKATINSLYRFGKYILYWLEKVEKNKTKLEELDFFNFITNEKQNLFAVSNATADKKIAELYKKNVFSEEELKKIQEWDSNWKLEYLKGKDDSSETKIVEVGDDIFDDLQLVHHPALEQSVIPGSAPLAEGSQKNVIVFLYLFAAELSKYATDKSSVFDKHFKNDFRKEAIQNALNNAALIAKNYKERLKNIREYFKEIKVVDSNFDPDNKCFSNTNSKSFGIVTFAPETFGGGNASIQTISKFPFIYRDLGLKQVFPSSISNSNGETSHHTHTHDNEGPEIFSVDDNGWWWNIGDSELNPKNLLEFKNTADSILLLANSEDWSLLKSQDSSKLKAFEIMIKKDSNENKGQNQSENNNSKNNSEFKLDIEKINTEGYKISYQKYHLWNEGLRSPIALNLLLDNLVDIMQKQYDPNFTASSKSSSNGNATNGSNGGNNKYQKAADWGDYWSSCFITGKHAKEKNGDTKKEKRETQEKSTTKKINNLSCEDSTETNEIQS